MLCECVYMDVYVCVHICACKNVHASFLKWLLIYLSIKNLSSFISDLISPQPLGVAVVIINNSYHIDT